MKGMRGIEISVGIVFIAAMAILGYYTILMGQDPFEGKELREFRVLFSDVGGLSVKDRVFVKGVLSGEVEDIALHEGVVETVLKVYREFPVYENYVISIDTNAVLGGKQINIDPGTKKSSDGRPLNELPDSFQFEGRLNDVMRSIGSLIDDNRANINASIYNLRIFSEKLNTDRSTLGRLVGDDTLMNETEGLVKDLRDTIEDSREQAPVTSFIRAALTAF